MDAVYLAKNTPFSAATGAKTVLKLITGSTFNVKIYEIGISIDGATSLTTVATVDLFISDETTVGTSGASVTPIQIKGRTQAHGCTVGSNFSAEGTTYTLLKSFYVPMACIGPIIIQNPLGLEEQAPGVDVADSIGIRINTASTQNVLAWLKFGRV